MSALKWIILEEGQMRDFIIEQDMKFQRAMRAVYGAQKPKLALVQPSGETPPLDSAASPSPIPAKGRAKISFWREICREICRSHRVSHAELIGEDRHHPIAKARHEAMYRMRTETTLTLAMIGRLLGGRDHSTVMAGIRKHMERMNGQK